MKFHDQNRYQDHLGPFLRAASGKKAMSIVALNLRELTSVADVFIICSGRSNRQVTSIGEFIIRKLKDSNIRPLSVEGLKDGRWALIDYGDVVVHVFLEAVRSFYDLEGLWVDAERIDVGPYVNNFNIDNMETNCE